MKLQRRAAYGLALSGVPLLLAVILVVIGHPLIALVFVWVGADMARDELRRAATEYEPRWTMSRFKAGSWGLGVALAAGGIAELITSRWGPDGAVVVGIGVYTITCAYRREPNE